MNLLLDTQAFPWWIDNDRRLGVTARVALQDPGNEVVFSVVSAWEIAIRARLGHLRTPPNLGSFVADQIAINGFRILPVDLAHAVGVQDLDDHHRDPFDRLLVPQAVAERLALVTSDAVVSRYPVTTLAAGR